MSSTEGEPSTNKRPSWGFEEGQEITDRYVALDVLGGGRSYEVYLAQDQVRLALVVVKLLRPNLVDEERERKTLAREVDALNRLAHPVIVRGFESDLDGPHPYVVLEHLDGPHLSRLIRRYPLELEQVLPLGIQISSAVHYMAKENMVHLDIKPRNIIMGAPPRLIDLSIARTTERAASLHGTIGTDAYMAPEQCDPTRATIGPPADVWGVGATLYHAVTGKKPFPRAKNYDKDDPLQRWPQLEREPEPMPEKVHPSLKELVLDTMTPDPNQRPTAEDVVRRLEPLVAGLPTRPVLRRMRPRLAPRKKPD